MKRKIDIAVISDVHLGTYGCQAKPLLNYLKSIRPEVLILNGDIIDMWQFKKSYFPTEHLLVVNRILRMMAKGTKIYYITGNHDDTLRRFSDFGNGNLFLRDQLVLKLNGKKHWFFHGDAFDVSILKARWLAKLGAKSYDWLIGLNSIVNKISSVFGAKPTSFASSLKMSVKKAVKFIDDFEKTAINMARTEGYDVVVCGHIHRPQMRVENDITYLNSGDWIEHLTALEYVDDAWSIYKYDPYDYDVRNPKLQIDETANIEADEARILMSHMAVVSQILQDKPAIKSNTPPDTPEEDGIWDGIEY